MKFAIVTLAVVFNLTLVVMYSRSLIGGGEPEGKAATGSVSERSASSPYKPKQAASSSEVKSGAKAVERKSEGAPAAVESGDGKETIDAKDGKELIEVAEDARSLRLRSGQGRPSAELMPGSRERGILSPANRANVDPPVVSPEAR